MNVRSVRLARIVRETLPALVVQLGEVGLVLRVDHVDCAIRAHHDVGYEVAERSVRGIAPLEREDCLALAPASRPSFQGGSPE